MGMATIIEPQPEDTYQEFEIKQGLLTSLWRSLKSFMKPDKIPKARKIFRDAFNKDSDFKMSYRANIAMLLHDHHGITNYDKRNRVAEDILNLIFY